MIDEHRGSAVLTVHDLSPESVLKMVQVDLATLDREPDSVVESFPFHGCTGGVSAFKSRPPWEFHRGGDELLLILTGQSELTVLEGGGRTVRTLRAGQLALVPQGHWHSNDAPEGVTMLWITPSAGNEHSWSAPGI